MKDITYCTNERCKRKDCLRHFDNLPGDGIYSFCNFEEKNCENFMCENFMWKGGNSNGKKKDNRDLL